MVDKVEIELGAKRKKKKKDNGILKFSFLFLKPELW
jgi:hypothetical protein